MAQSRANSNSLAITIVLLFSIVAIFIIQIGLQDRAIAPEISKGADLAVIGGTTAALLAALEAAEHGAQVVLFLNGQEPGEDTSFLVKGGLAAPLASPQNELEIGFTSERLAEMISEHGGAINDPLLLNAFRDSSSSLFLWANEFEDLSFDFLPDPESKPYFHLANLHADLLFRKQLIERINKSPIVVIDELRVEDILLSPNGDVQALLLENDQSEKITYYFRAVILADGGYSGDIHFWQDYLPPENLFVLRPGQKGYGLRLAYSLGADIVQMGFFQKRPLLYEPVSKESALLPLMPWQDTFLVNTNGQILTWAESSPRDVLTFIHQTPPGSTYILAPEERALSYISFFSCFEELDDLLEVYPLDDLLRIPGLRMQASYYLAPISAALEYTLGGISITPQGEVKEDGKVIKGLYAAGEIVGGLHGEALLPGMALSETFFTAKTAGQFAAEYAQR
ncbi:MAG: FAD-binding protein [Bacillota bacterium]|nr:FAD-binding protein [Bacillota bacterium]